MNLASRHTVLHVPKRHTSWTRLHRLPLTQYPNPSHSDFESCSGIHLGFNRSRNYPLKSSYDHTRAMIQFSIHGLKTMPCARHSFPLQPRYEMFPKLLPLRLFQPVFSKLEQQMIWSNCGHHQPFGYHATIHDSNQVTISSASRLPDLQSLLSRFTV